MTKDIWIWTWDPGMLIGIAIWTAGYILLMGPIRRRKNWGPPVSWNRQAAFHLGTLVLFVALVSPLDHLSDVYLLSAHMVQHMLLLLVAPPLWLLGMPNGWFDPLIPAGHFQSFLRGVTRPAITFLIFNGVLWVWHIPALYDAALYNEQVHILEHLFFLAAGVIGWWPILGFLPIVAPRASYPVQLIYLFAAMLSTAVLGILITFAATPVYPFYLNAPRVLDNSSMPSFANGPRLWGLSIMDDQVTAGLIMWVAGKAIYFVEMLIILTLLFREQERKNIGSPDPRMK
jgi:cytochrome c oxidase assembly factor CtaG